MVPHQHVARGQDVDAGRLSSGATDSSRRAVGRPDSPRRACSEHGNDHALVDRPVSVHFRTPRHLGRRGVALGGRRTLRRRVVCGQPTHPRDRDPHRRGRATIRGESRRGTTVTRAGGLRPSRRPCYGIHCDARHALSAVWCGANGPDHLPWCRGRACTRRWRRVMDSRKAGSQVDPVEALRAD